MTIRKAIGTVLLCTLLIGAVGTSIGLGLGKFTPGYYRAIVRSGREPGFEPISVGIGLGLTLGTAGGVVLGIAIVGLLCWRETRVTYKLPRAQPDEKAWVNGRSVRQFLRIGGVLLALAFCLTMGWCAGSFTEEEQAQNRECSEQRRAMARVLSSDPAFREVLISDDCDGGWVILTGHVKTQTDHTRLREQLRYVIGKDRADYAVDSVKVP